MKLYNSGRCWNCDLRMLKRKQQQTDWGGKWEKHLCATHFSFILEPRLKAAWNKERGTTGRGNREPRRLASCSSRIKKGRLLIFRESRGNPPFSFSFPVLLYPGPQQSCGGEGSTRRAHRCPKPRGKGNFVTDRKICGPKGWGEKSPAANSLLTYC